MRLIDADALLDKITEYGEPEVWGADEYAQGLLKQYRMDVAAIKAAPVVNNWISVKDRLPELQTPVLVYVPPYSDDEEEYCGHVAMSYYTYSAKGGFWAGTDGNVYGAIGIIHEPTYWMPLPEPPEEGELNDT